MSEERGGVRSVAGSASRATTGHIARDQPQDVVVVVLVIGCFTAPQRGEITLSLTPRQCWRSCPTSWIYEVYGDDVLGGESILAEWTSRVRR